MKAKRNCWKRIFRDNSESKFLLVLVLIVRMQEAGSEKLVV